MKKAFLALTLGLLVHNAFNYPSVPGCPALSDNDFRKVDLAKMGQTTFNEPIELDMAWNSSGDVDVFFVERHGAVKKIDGTSGAISNIGTIPDVFDTHEQGVHGIVLDPDFANNGWMYIYWSCLTAGDTYRIARFTFDGANLNIGSEAVIMDIWRNGQGWHTGGAMEFDVDNDLWITVGENSTGTQGPNCTDKAQGGILRIHPLPVAEGTTDWGIGKTYTVPSGNYGEYWAEKFDGAGKASVAAAYRDANQVMPELFVKGARNPYTLTIDPFNKIVGWGDCGPDHGAVTEEHNLTSVPGFFGFPYWAGVQYERGSQGTYDVPTATCGAGTLPPAIDGTHSYQQDCAMTGPIMLYDPTISSSVQFPPNFHGKWIIGDFNSDDLWWTSFTDVPTTRAGMTFPVMQITPKVDILNSITFWDPMDINLGPDGALYINNYSGWFNSSLNTSIVKIEYIGEAPSAQCIQNAMDSYPIDVVGARRRSSARNTEAAVISSESLQINIPGRHTVRITSLQGRLLREIAGSGEKTYSFKNLGLKGVNAVSVETEKGTINKSVAMF